MNHSSQKLRIIFAGTPFFSVPTLKALFSEDHYEIIAVYTQPDRPSGRGQKLVQSPVKQFALENNLPIFQPKNFKSIEDVEELANHKADIMIVVAYGLLLPLSILNAPRLGCLNIHASLLPRWRGAAPIQRAVLEGDQQTGVCIMQMDQGLDTGDVWSCAQCAIEPDDSSQILFDKLSLLGAQLLMDTLPKIITKELTLIPQSTEGITYANKILKTESPIDWLWSKEKIVCHVNGLNPFPGATTTIHYENKTTELIKIWDIRIVSNVDLIQKLDQAFTRPPNHPATLLILEKHLYVNLQAGWLQILELQQPNKNRISASSFILNKTNISGAQLI